MSVFVKSMRLIFWLMPSGAFGRITPGSASCLLVHSTELDQMREFLRSQDLGTAVCLLGSIPHELFLTLLSRSVAYIRTPVTDGVCSSVLESLKLRIPVLAADNGARPSETEMWKEGDLDGLLALMEEAVTHHSDMVARIPEIEVEDNTKKLADSIERLSLKNEPGKGSLQQKSVGS